MALHRQLSNDQLGTPLSRDGVRPTVPATSYTGRALRIRRLVMGPLTRLLNPYISTHAGNAGVLVFGLVRHRGRRSGRVFATPLATRPIPGGFLIPLTFGSTSDWCQNVLAAGGCVVRWNGAEYPMVNPEIVEAAMLPAEIRAAFSFPERLQLRLMGFSHLLRLRHATYSSCASPTAGPLSVWPTTPSR